MRSRKETGAAAGWVVAIIVLLCAVGFLVWWFGFRYTSTGGTDTPTPVYTKTSQPAGPTDTQQKTTIRNNWMAFFNGKTPVLNKVALLQNGQAYSQIIDAQSQSKTGQETTATVSSVNLISNSKATLTYDVYISGQQVLKGQTGQSVQENGTWKVSDAAFCNLLQLSGSAPLDCPGIGQS